MRREKRRKKKKKKTKAVVCGKKIVTLPFTVNEPLKRFLIAAHRNAEIILAVTV